MMFRALLAVAQLASQTALVGTVTDSSGSVVPGAVVVAVNIGPRTHETTTNAQGHYDQFSTGSMKSRSPHWISTFKVSGTKPPTAGHGETVWQAAKPSCTSSRTPSSRHRQCDRLETLNQRPIF